MRCLYCGKQLALFRRLTGSGEFCSEAHKKSYHDEYNRLALTRLIAAQTKSEEAHTSFATPSTMQLATGDRKPNKTNSDLRTTPLTNRWSDGTAPNPRMLVPPEPEAPPPPPETFKSQKMAAPAKPKVHGPASPSPMPFRAELQLPTLNLGLRTEQPPPPFADPLPSQPIPGLPAAPLSGPPSPTNAPPIRISAPAIDIPVAIRPITGLGLRPTVPLNLWDFLPPVPAAPRFDPTPEALRFAVMVFGAPTLSLRVPHADSPAIPAAPQPPLWNWNAPVQDLPRPPGTSPSPVPFTSNSVPEPITKPQLGTPEYSSIPNKLASVRDKLAAMDAAMPDHLVNPPIDRGDSLQPPDTTATPLKLPTMPSKRRTSRMPSVTEAPPPEPERNRSIWSALKKYINK